jgi:hypothetical protein
MNIDNGNGGGDDFSEFEAAGNVEVGESNLASSKGEGEGEGDEKPAKPAGKTPTPRPKPAPKTAPKVESNQPGDNAGDDDTGEGEGDGEGEGEGKGDDDKPASKRLPPSERIRELNKRLRQSERLRVATETRLAALETGGKNGGSTGAEGGGNSADDIGPAPDPQDTAKYPLGHLDDRYIEDKLEYLATVKAGKQADAVLQRQQENERRQQIERAQADLLEKVDDLAVKGSEIYDDYQEAVVDAGMRGDWALSQPTFEAAHEAENGHTILYNLSQDTKEAARVAALSPYAQLKYVMEKDAEITAKNKGRKIPKAGEPPATNTRGTSSRTRINPATDNLNDFEKAWETARKK